MKRNCLLALALCALLSACESETTYSGGHARVFSSATRMPAAPAPTREFHSVMSQNTPKLATPAPVAPKPAPAAMKAAPAPVATPAPAVQPTPHPAAQPAARKAPYSQNAPQLERTPSHYNRTISSRRQPCPAHPHGAVLMPGQNRGLKVQH